MEKVSCLLYADSIGADAAFFRNNNSLGYCYYLLIDDDDHKADVEARKEY